MSGVPTLVLLTSDGKIVARRGGYLEVAEFLKWIDDGRELSRRGLWEGAAPGGELAEFAAKAAAGSLGTNDLARLLAFLGRPNPNERAAAAKVLLGLREQAVPQLIEALADPYLGGRIAAAELLQKLAPESVAADPWQSPDELKETLAELKRWWAKAGKLPPPTPARPLDSTEASSISIALGNLRGNDPVGRTEAMSTLAAHGPAVLPALREAIRVAEAKGDHRSVALMEDVRWSVLIPDLVERQAGGARHALARGTSSERQAAAARLGKTGREAIPALAELVNDSDGLVIESAVRALSSVGGKDVISALAALLKAADVNLRMTAAQALGKTKDPQAAQPLLEAVRDPNEIVACTALAAIEEAYSEARQSSNEKNVAPELVAALKPALTDPRWRVRAAAAEVAGKMRMTEVGQALLELLQDKDGFVVKHALDALNSLGSVPPAPQLAELAKRLPELRSDVVGLMIEKNEDATLETVLEMFTKGGVEIQLAILNAFARTEHTEPKTGGDPWRPLLTNAVSASDSRVRRLATEVLGMRPLKSAAELVGPMLNDADAETRAAAMDVVLQIIAGKRRVPSRMGMPMQVFSDEDKLTEQSGSSRKARTNQVYATAAQLAAWHASVAAAPGAPDLRRSIALFGAGDAKTDLPKVLAALEQLDAQAIQKLAASPAGVVLVRKLPWPEGQPALEKLCGSPTLFALAAAEHVKAAPEIRAFLLDPARFKAAVEPAAGEELSRLLAALLGGDDHSYGEENPQWTLLSQDERTSAVISALLGSTNAGWRAAGVFARARGEPEKYRTVFDAALRDTNPWVRVAAVQGLAQTLTDRPQLEARLGPLMSEVNSNLAEVAACALLDPELRAAAGSLDSALSDFAFEKLRIDARGSYSVEASEDRPLSVHEGSPAFLDQARARLKSAPLGAAGVFALLLAQYGQFDGLEALAARWTEQGRGEKDFSEYALRQAILAGVSLSRDPKYLPLARKVMQNMKSDYDLQRVLKALRGMTGPEARQLRVELNKRMRQGGNNPVID